MVSVKLLDRVPLMYSEIGAVYTEPLPVSGMLYRKTIEFVATGEVNSTYLPLPCSVTALR